MPMQKITFAKSLTQIICALCTLIVVSAISNSCSGQILQKPLRWLGEGYSAGYHRCNPGPVSDYYNPYSAHNSMLISRLPQFQGQNFESFTMNNLASQPVYRGVPYSVYAAPRNLHSQYGYEQFGGYTESDGYGLEGQIIDGSFEPYEPEIGDDDGEYSSDNYDDEMDDDDSDEPGSSKEMSDESAFQFSPSPNTRRSTGSTQSEFRQSSFPRDESVLTPPTPTPSLTPATQQSGLFNPFNEN